MLRQHFGVRACGLGPAAALCIIGMTFAGHSTFAADALPAWTLPPVTDGIEFNVEAGVASDYVYRGVTLSDRKPSLDASIEAVLSPFYANVAVATVRLPTLPAAEIAFEGGIRKEEDKNYKLELGVTYFSYPGEALPNGGINYWEVSLTAEKKFSPLTLSAEYSYSPSISNTGAWSHYVEIGLAHDLGKFTPKEISIELSGALGYSWFGNQSAALGGFPLPNYLNWNAGVSLTYDAFTLDLRYYDTNLSREDCSIFTGDPNAIAGGRVDPITNPLGLTSRWCGAAFVGKLSVAWPSP
jgi:uncharacterized protein (TIGR02001 family)